MLFMDLDRNGKPGLSIQIENTILKRDCQSQSNPLNWIDIRIEQSSNTLYNITIKYYELYSTLANIFESCLRKSSKSLKVGFGNYR